ncbi:hypothetical protein ABT300_13185 [Streptomyces sp. NPDC001027]|uniref:hypothetical protein n=1 Tax=Streptomyces sp. NPDC001027 TaxID=3154771 RepID=UPI0033314F9C
MADTTSHTPDGADPSQEHDCGPVRKPVGTDRVRFSLLGWVLAPLTTLQARSLMAEFGPGMDAQTAWMTARLARHPDEVPYARWRLTGEEKTG